MPIDRAQVRHVANLARLQLSETEEELYAAQLGHVLEYIERLQQVEVSGIEPLSFAGDDQTFGDPIELLRPDEPRPSLSRDVVLSQAPAQDGSAFLVPKIIE